MTSRQWRTLMVGLWACYLVAWFTLDGLPRAVVLICGAAGFVWLSVERWRNWRHTRTRI